MRAEAVLNAIPATLQKKPEFIMVSLLCALPHDIQDEAKNQDRERDVESIGRYHECILCEISGSHPAMDDRPCRLLLYLIAMTLGSANPAGLARGTTRWYCR